MESKEIKNYLKTKGINTSKISIKKSPCGYSERFNITLKDIDINIDEVSNLVKGFEEIDYDERTGEILQGGNTYIFVEYDYSIINEANNKYNPLVLDKLYNELLKRTKEEQEAYYNGECNPVLTLANKLICYRDGKSLMIRDLEKLDTRRSGETYIAETLIKMGKLNEVLKGE